MTTKGILSNRLLGRIAKRNDELPHLKCLSVEGDKPYRHDCDRCTDPRDSYKPISCWPFDQEPNATGEFLAIIEAAWIEENSIKVTLRSVMTGKMADAWLTHLLVLEPQS